MEFWKMSYESGWVTLEQLRGAVDDNKKDGMHITKAEFKEITGVDY